MMEVGKLWLLRLLRVPPRPAPPEGSPGSIRIFNAGRNYFRFRVALWLLGKFGIFLLLIGLLFVPAPRKPPPEWVAWIWRGVHAGAFALLAVSMPFGYFRLKLDYDMRWYIVTDRSLRTRSGIWSVSEITMTFANIQGIHVSAGPLQTLFGLADVRVSSAGGTAGPHGTTARVAVFAGVDNAGEIRDLIAERLRQYRDTGLGDPDARDHRKDLDAAGAARQVLEEARALRAVLATPGS